MLERIGAASIVIGILLGFIALSLMTLQFVAARFRKSPSKRRRGPLVMLGLAVLMTTAPIVVNSVMTRVVSLGPLNKIVAGERHLTLTGWDRHDYSVITKFPDTVVLQMANSDVNDDTLKFLVGLNRLRELDLNDSQITDACLVTISKLPNLHDLRMARTKITDEGFRQNLLAKESLLNLDLTATSVASKTVREWKAAKPDRKALK